MAGLFFRANSGVVALTASTAKTVVQLVAASNHRVVIHQALIHFDGTDTTAGRVLLRALKQTTAGTMSSLTLVKCDTTADETIQTTAQHTATAEPTASTVQLHRKLDPTREVVYDFPGRTLIIPGGERFGLEFTSASSINVTVELLCEE